MVFQLINYLEMEIQYPWQQKEIYHVDMETWKNQEDPMFNKDNWSLHHHWGKTLIQNGESREVEVQAQDGNWTYKQLQD